MADRDGLRARGWQLEEEYFRRREAELLEKIRAAARRDAERREMGKYHGIADEEILKGFEEVGYNRDTVQVLHLVPLLQVAWADGGVSAAEREKILEIAAARHVVAGTPAHAQLVDWLDRRPTKEFFDRTLSLIADVLEALPDEPLTRLKNDVFEGAYAVANASGGFLGLGSRLSGDELALLERFRAEFEAAHEKTLAKKKG